MICKLFEGSKPKLSVSVQIIYLFFIDVCYFYCITNVDVRNCTSGIEPMGFPSYGQRGAATALFPHGSKKSKIQMDIENKGVMNV